MLSLPGRKRRQMPGVCPGGMLKLRFGWYITIFMQSRVPLGPGKFHVVVLVILAWTIILFSLGCDDRVWTSAKQTDCKHSTKKINKKILKVLNGQTEPQTSELIVKIKQVHESHLLQRNTENVWQITEKPQLHVRFWPFKPWKAMGASDFS